MNSTTITTEKRSALPAGQNVRSAGNIYARRVSHVIMSRVASVLLAVGAWVAAVPAQGILANFEVSAVWHDNVTNAERAEDLLGAFQWRGETSVGVNHVLPLGHRIQGAAGVRAEIWPRFDGLDVVAPGVSGRWEWKPWLGLNRPVLWAEAETEWVGAREAGRSGWGTAGRLAVRQRIGAVWLVGLAHEWRRFDARDMAFDRTSREWHGWLEWSLGPTWTVAVEARRRRGTVISYSRPPRPDLEAIGKPITYVDTFAQAEPWIAYYFEAETRSFAVQLERQLGRATVSLRHEYRHTRHAGPGYKNHLTSLSWSAPF